MKKKIDWGYLTSLTLALVLALTLGGIIMALTGLACAIGARVGIFNVGGEGQLYLGAIVSAYIGVVLTDLPAIVVIPAAALGAMAVGGFYAWIPGVLKVKLKVNEVITTIMMNSIAIYLCAWLSDIAAAAQKNLR